MLQRAVFSRLARLLIFFLICSLAVPLPMSGMAAATSVGHTDAARVHARLNSPERAAAIAEAARLDAAARAAYEAGDVEAAAQAAPSVIARSEATRQSMLSPSSGAAEHDGKSAASRPQAPQSVTEVLFNAATGFAGVPGLAPQRGVDGSLDEGLGFHQDGTARKAGGVTGSSGPSANGQRARSYMQTGLQNGYGMNGYASGLYEELHYDLWGRNDPTRGGRVSGSGAYGGGYSRDMSDFDPMSMAMDRGLNYGAGLLNSAGEAALSGLVDGGRARLNFRLDRDGYFNGEGDALLPFYDSARTTIYTQLGARSMHDSGATRWIGNFGLGQRWFPFAEGDDIKSGNYDAGMLMLGYNAFFDYDITRDHQRGGIGVEAQYDWLRLASNYYFPLSDWKGSEDFDSRFVKERPAEGWDARVKAYLPFYRNVAITGAYSQWYGDHVGMFGASKLEKDPKVWSYGLEYTPVPLVSGFVTQRSTERGRTDTEFGLNFTYHFQMPWEDQISHSKVAELRTVGGSRHEFVDRENRIILEYKAKNNFHVEYLGKVGANQFKFRIRNGFDKYMAGQQVRVSAGGGVTLAEAQAPAPTTFLAQAGEFFGSLFSVSTAHAADFSQTYTTDGNGEFIVRLDNVTTTPVVLTIQAGNTSQSVTLHEATLTGGLTAAVSTLANNANTTLTLSGPANAAVTWVVAGPGVLSAQQNTTSASGAATATLTANAMGIGDIVVKATVNGQEYTVTVVIVPYAISFDQPGGYTPSFSGSGVGSKASQTVIITVTQNSTPVSGAMVSLTASMNDASNKAIVSGRQNQFYGLKVSVNGGALQDGNASFPVSSDTTDSNGKITLNLEDIVGERTLSLTASVTPPVGSAVTAVASVAFGQGPLSVFTAPLSGTYRWADNAPLSNAGNASVSNFPAANACGTTLTAAQLQALSNGYDAATRLPSVAQFQAVSDSGNGAWSAAGWPDDFYWSGEVSNYGNYANLVTRIGNGYDYPVYIAYPVVCLR